MGEDTSDLVDGFSKYRAELQALTGVDIQKNEYEYKDMLTIFTELAAVWDDLESDMARARVGEILGGTRNQSGIMSTIQNIRDAMGAYDDAMNSAGTAIEANNKHMETTEAHIAQLKASFQELSADVFNSSFLKAFVDGLKTVVEVLDAIVDKFGMIGGFTAIAGVVALLMKLKSMNLAATVFTPIILLINNIKNYAATLGVSIGSLSASFAGVAAGVALVTAAVIAGSVALYKYLKPESYKDLKQTAEESANEYANTVSELQNVNTELETTQSRLAELSGKKLSPVEQAEYDRLVNYNNQLLRQKELLESTAKIQSRQAALDALKALNAESLATGAAGFGNLTGFSFDPGKGLVGNLFGQGTVQQHLDTAVENIKTLTDRETEIQDELYNLQEKRNQYLNGEYQTDNIYDKLLGMLGPETNVSALDNAIAEKEKELQGVRESISEYQEEGYGYASDINTFLSSMYDADGNFVLEGTIWEDQARSIYESLTGSVDGLLRTTEDGSRQIESKIRNVLSIYQDDYNSLLSLASERKYSGGITVEDISTDYSDLALAITSRGSDLQDAVDIINSEAEVSSRNAAEIRSVIDASLDKMKTSEEGIFTEYIEGLRQATWDAWNKANAKGQELEFYKNVPDSAKTDHTFLAELKERGYGLPTGSISEYRQGLEQEVQKLTEESASLGELHNEAKDIYRDIADYIDSMSIEDQAALADAIESGEFTFDFTSAGDALSGLESFVEQIRSTRAALNDAYGELSGELSDIPKLFADDSEFNTSYDAYINKLDTLKSALDKWSDGSLDLKSMNELKQSFAELNAYDETNFGEGLANQIELVLGSAKDGVGIIGLFNQKIKELGEDTDSGRALAAMLKDIISLYTESAGVIENMKSQVSQAATYQTDFANALQSSASATGLSTDQVENLTKAYKNLDSFDPSKLFEHTYNGIHLNREELDKLNSEIQNNTLEGLYKSLSDQYAQYNAMKEAGMDTTGLEKDIADAEMLISQYEGMTSAYQNWVSAKSGGDERDSYASVGSSIEGVEELINTGWGGDSEVTSFFDLIYGDHSSGDVQKDLETLNSVIEGTGHTFSDYWKYDENKKLTSLGLYDFLDDVNALLGDSYAWKDENGQYGFDFTGDKINDVGEAFKWNTQFIQLMERAMIDAGFAVEFTNSRLAEMRENAASSVDGYTSLTDAVTEYEEGLQRLNELGIDPTQSVFGNIDLNNRQALEWNKDTIEQYREALESWGISTPEEMLGSVSTVFGGSENFDGVEIAFSPMLQTEHGAELLTSDTVYSYINSLISKAEEQGGGSWSSEDLLALDAEGLEIEGKHIQGLIAAIGETAIATGEAMHYLGKDGALAMAFDSLEELAGVEVDLDFSNLNVDDLTDTISELENEKINIEATSDGTEETESRLEAIQSMINLLNNTQISMRINTVLSGGKQTVDSLLAMSDEELTNTLHINTDQVDEARAKLESLAETSETATITVTLNETQFNELTAPDKEATVTYNTNTEAPDNYTPEDKEATVIFDKNVEVPESYTPSNKQATVYYYANTNSLPTSFSSITRYVNYVATGAAKGPLASGTLGGGFASGTVSKSGSAYNAPINWRHAYSGGHVALDQNEYALVNELGTESIIRDGQWMLLPHGMHQQFLKKGDIVLSAKQTRALINTGAAPGHARAYAAGTLLSNAYGRGFGGTRPTISASSKKTYTSYSSSGSSSYYSPVYSSYDDDDYTPSSSSDDDDDEDEPKKFDWIEIALKRIQRLIQNIGKVAESTFMRLSVRLSATDDEIRAIGEELSLQEAAENRYLSEASSVGLSETLAAKVRDGTIDINEYDEDTQELIDEYQEWYEKALDCADAIDELHESLASLYKDKFDVTQDDFENQLSLLEHLTTTYDNGLDDIAERGYFASTKFFKASRKVEEENLKILNEELTALIQRMSDGINSGEIEEYSEAWYDMQNSINGVKEKIQETNTEILKLNNSIRDTNWEYFDFLQERISDITDEGEFFISLMEHTDLFTDKGQFTDTGMATMGIHGQDYNVYMNQADRYAKEIIRLNAEIAKDDANKDLIERREELLDLQRESILNAENEKEAIKDLVAEGINLELESLNEVIDAYKESLDVAEDLYDYQKKINDQAEDVATLRKQIAAYQGDDSEESRARIQKLNKKLDDAVEKLGETEHDRTISEQKAMLDNLYTEYEDILNQRLDDVDRLITDMIDTVNDNAAGINDTLISEADDVGYTISDSMRAIWAGGEAHSVISRYGDAFLDKLTSVNMAINGIAMHVASMVAASDTTAEEVISTATKSTEALPAPEPAPTPPAEPAATNESTGITDQDYYGVAFAIWEGIHGWGAGDERVERLEQKGFDAARVQSLVNALYSDFMSDNYAKYGVDPDLSKYAYNKYLHGGLVRYTGLAQVDGTPGRPESFLDATDTANLARLTEVMKDSSTLKLGALGLNGIKGLGVAGEGGDTIFNINIPIDHVSDYNDFMNQMKQDNKFEKFVQSVTIDRVAGANRLAKNKYNW